MSNSFERVLLVVNPMAQNGRAGADAEYAFRRLRMYLGDEAISVHETEYVKHAIDIARASDGFDLLIALGGDGLVHEIINGLMMKDERERPIFGLIPVGSGNDYAASLGVSNKVTKAVEQIFDAPVHRVDIGCCNGEFFAETVSFGLDAAIAIDTMERRRRTGRTGTMLYFSAGLDQMLHHLDSHVYRAKLANGKSVEGEGYIFAIQNGPSYGGGFKVCPDARLNDGMLDICIAHPPLNALTATGLFILAKEGKHKDSKKIELHKTSALHLEFDAAVPAQIDGEILCGTVFDISVQPGARRLLAPSHHCFEGEAEASYVRIPE